MEKPKTRVITLAKKTVRKLNEGELSQAAGGYFATSEMDRYTQPCAACSTSGYVVGKRCTLAY